MRRGILFTLKSARGGVSHMRRFVTLVFLVTAFFPLAFGQASAGSTHFAGRWDATIRPATDTGGGAYDVRFGLTISGEATSFHAVVDNGTDVMPFSRVEWDGKTLTMHFDSYDGRLTVHCAQPSCMSLVGEYSRMTHAGEVHYQFEAKRRSESAVPRRMLKTQGPALAGKWTFSISFHKGSPDSVAPGTFVECGPEAGGDGEGNDVQGTIALLSGDLGMLHGYISAKGSLPTFVLTRFDGIHVTRMVGKFLSADHIEGTLQFDPTTIVPFTATRSGVSAAAALNPESVTKVRNPDVPFRFHGIDPLTGREVTSEDPRFRGKAIIVDIFGTWCPNCHDEEPVLVDLYNRYHEQGLEIVGLAYEYTNDEKRSAWMLALYRKQYGIPFTLLVAGSTDDGQIAKTLPQLIGFGAYPTTIFLDREHRVKIIHAGFESPATGMFDAVKARFQHNVEEILNRPH